MNYTPPEPKVRFPYGEYTFNIRDARFVPLFTEKQLRDEVAKARRQAIEECAAECLSQHENGNYKHDTREDCHDAIRALAASPQEQT